MTIYYLAILLLHTVLFSSSTIAIDCIPNPAYTIPSLPASNPLLQPLRSALDAALHELLVDDEQARTAAAGSAEGEARLQETSEKIGRPPLFANVTSFSIAVTTKEETVWTWHHSAEFQGHENKTVDGKTAYRIASCTKAFTVLALLLQEDLDWDDPVTKWIPELRRPEPASGIDCGRGLDMWERLEDERLLNHVRWESVTLRSLASQLSGVARQYGVFDLLNMAPPQWIDRLEELGFPPLNEDDAGVPIGNGTADRDMSVEDFLQGVRTQYPIFAPDYQSTYSNTGFILLGMVLEKMTGKKYADVIAERITTPLGLNRTTFSKPDDSDGVIPTVPNDWDWGNEIIAPTGGLYSTSDDTVAFLRSILRSDLLEEETTNKWLHVQSEAPGLTGFYGMPWEILRTSRATSDNRTITVYAKDGGLQGYFSDLAMIPEFGVGVSILTAGRHEAYGMLKQRVLEVVLKSMDDILRDWTEKIYAGTFVAQWHLNSSLELGIAETGGLEIKKWISNGTDFLNVMARASAFPPLDNDFGMDGMQARIFPTGLKRSWKNARGVQAVGEVWRIQILPLESRDQGIWTGYCMGDVDEGTYAGRAINEMLLFRGADGRLEKVRIPVLKVELLREKKWMKWMNGAKGLVEQLRI